MNPKLSQLAEYIQTLELDDAEKQELAALLSKEGASDEDIIASVSAYLKSKNQELDAAMAKELDPLYDEADAEMKQAEAEFNTTMKELDAESQQVLKEAGDQLDALPE